MIHFSHRGAPPTQLELQLFAEQPAPSNNIWIHIGQRIGLSALLIVMDEIGSECIRVPTRIEFLKKLWRPQRDEHIRMMHKNGVRIERISEQMHISRPNVLRILGKQSSGEK